MGKSIRVAKGKEVFEIDAQDLPFAAKDGFLPTERIIVANSKTKESFEIDPADYLNAVNDGFEFADLAKKKEPIPSNLPPSPAPSPLPSDANIEQPVTIEQIRQLESIPQQGTLKVSGTGLGTQYDVVTTESPELKAAKKRYAEQLGIDYGDLQEILQDFPNVGETFIASTKKYKEQSPELYRRYLDASYALRALPKEQQAAFNEWQSYQSLSQLESNMAKAMDALSSNKEAQRRLYRTNAPFINPSNDDVFVGTQQFNKDYSAKLQSPISEFEYSGLKTLEIFNPDVAKQYKDILLNHSDVREGQLAYERVSKELESIGRENLIRAAKETNDIVRYYENAIKQAETPEKAQAIAAEAQNDTRVKNAAKVSGAVEQMMLRQQYDSLRYTQLGMLQAEKVYNDIARSNMTTLDALAAMPKEFLVGGGRIVNNALQTLGDLVVGNTWVMPDAETKNMISAFSQATAQQESDPRYLQKSLYNLTPDLQAQVDDILKSDADSETKRSQVIQLVLGNPNKIIPNPKADETDVKSQDILLGGAKLFGEVFALSLLARGTGAGAASTRMQQAATTFGSTALGFYNDMYNSAVSSGSKNPRLDAALDTAIAALSELISPDYQVVRRFLGKSSSPILLGLTEETWDAVMRRLPNLPTAALRGGIAAAKNLGGEVIEEVAGAAGQQVKDRVIMGRETAREDASFGEKMAFGQGIQKFSDAVTDAALQTAVLMAVPSTVTMITNARGISADAKTKLYALGVRGEAGLPADMPEKIRKVVAEMQAIVANIKDNYPELNEKQRTEMAFNMYRKKAIQADKATMTGKQKEQADKAIIEADDAIEATVAGEKAVIEQIDGDAKVETDAIDKKIESLNPESEGYKEKKAELKEEKATIKQTAESRKAALKEAVRAAFPQQITASQQKSASLLMYPPKPLMEMTSEEISKYAGEYRNKSRKLDREFENKTEEEKEAAGYYDIVDETEDLYELSRRVNYIENAESVEDIASSAVILLRDLKNREPNQYQLAELAALRRRVIELELDGAEVAKAISKKVIERYDDPEDAEEMVKEYLSRLFPKSAANEPTTTEANQPTTEIEGATNPQQIEAGTTTGVQPSIGGMGQGRTAGNVAVGGNEALRDVESTAKALDGVDFPAIESILFRGGNRYDVSKIASNGVSFSKDKNIATYWAGSRKGGILQKFLIKQGANILSEIPETLIPKDRATEQDKERIVNYAKAKKYDGVDLSKVLREGEVRIFTKDAIDELTNFLLAKTYHEAKADGSNPELVKAVEDLLGGSQQPSQPTPQSQAESVGNVAEQRIPQQGDTVTIISKTDGKPINYTYKNGDWYFTDSRGEEQKESTRGQKALTSEWQLANGILEDEIDISLPSKKSLYGTNNGSARGADQSILAALRESMGLSSAIPRTTNSVLSNQRVDERKLVQAGEVPPKGASYSVQYVVDKIMNGTDSISYGGTKQDYEFLSIIGSHPYFKEVRLQVVEYLKSGADAEAITNAALIKIQNGFDIATLNHEMMHILTVGIMESPDSALTQPELEFKREIFSIINEIDPKYEALDQIFMGYERRDYPFELIAEAFTGRDASRFLQKKTVQRNRLITEEKIVKIRRNLLQRVIDAIKRLFGKTIEKTKKITVTEKRRVTISAYEAISAAFEKVSDTPAERLRQLNTRGARVFYSIIGESTGNQLKNWLKSVIAQFPDATSEEIMAAISEDAPQLVATEEQQKAVADLVNQTIAENAVQEQSAEGVDVRQQPEDGEGMGEGNAEIPPTPPTDDQVGSDEEGPKLRNKAVVTRIYNSEKVPQRVKDALKDDLKYEPKSQVEASNIAKSIIEEFGIDEAVLRAAAGTFHGDVNSMIFGNALNQLTLAEREAPESEKQAIAEKFLEVTKMFNDAAQSSGRFISAIQYFYQKSPLGMHLLEQENRGEQFREWLRSREGNYQEAFDDFVNSVKGQELIEKEVRERLKKERAEKRTERKKKVNDAIDKWINDLGKQTYSSVVPPTVLIPVLKAAKGLYNAGESVLEIVEKAVDSIDEKMNGADWDRDAFRTKLTGMLDEAESADELKRQRAIEKFRNKLKGLSEEQKDKLIRKSLRKLVADGALEFDDFKKMLADIIGMGEMSPEEIAAFEQTVKDMNAASDVADEIANAETLTPEMMQRYNEARVKAEKAAIAYGDLVYNKPDITKRLLSYLQLAPLGIKALVTNPFYNVWQHVAVRIPTAVVGNVVDTILYRASQVGNSIWGTDVLYPKNDPRNIAEVQKQFFKGGFLGTKKAMSQVVTGLTDKDYIQKDMYNSRNKPLVAIRDIFNQLTKKKLMTNKQIFDKMLQGTLGITMEGVARLLNVGDKPMRYAAERAEAARFAKELGLKDLELDFFMELPREIAFREYKKRGMTDEAAGEKADEIVDGIIKSGEKSVFQGDNILATAIDSFFEKFGLTGRLFRVLNLPYVKTPLNSLWSLYNLVNPYVALAQVTFYGGRAVANKSRKDYEESKYWLGHAVSGFALHALMGALVQYGIFSPPDEDDESKREREGRKTYNPNGKVNITKLMAFLDGSDPNAVKNGIIVDIQYFGVMGVLGAMITKKNQEMTEEQRKNGMTFIENQLMNLDITTKHFIDQGIFGQTSLAIEAFQKRGAALDQWLLGMINMGTNVVQPAMYAQISRAQLPYYSRQKADDFKGQVKNSMLSRSSVLRDLTGQMPPSKIGVWGDTMSKGGSEFMDVMGRLFGVTRENDDNFAQPIYEDYMKYNEPLFFPPALKPELDGKKLTAQQYDDLQIFVGQQRKELAKPYVNDGATIPFINKKYSELSKEEKLKALEYIYEVGKENGIVLFTQKYKEFQKPFEAPTYESIMEKINNKYMQSFKEMLPKIRD